MHYSKGGFYNISLNEEYTYWARSWINSWRFRIPRKKTYRTPTNSKHINIDNFGKLIEIQLRKTLSNWAQAKLSIIPLNIELKLTKFWRWVASNIVAFQAILFICFSFGTKNIWDLVKRRVEKFPIPIMRFKNDIFFSSLFIDLPVYRFH